MARPHDPLFERCWPGMTARLALAAAAGADWDACTTPFVDVVGGIPVAHAGVIEVPLVLGGQRLTACGVHAVATDPDHRRRGHARRVLERALAHADRRTGTCYLTTDNPAVYAGVGFRDVPQTVFAVPADRTGTDPRIRRLSQDVPADVALVHRLCRSRTAVSARCGTLETGWMLVINECLVSGGFHRLHHLPDLDALVVFDRKGDDLRLLDIVAAAPPSLDAVLARLPAGARRVVCHFALDRFDAPGACPEPYDPTDHIMVRGPWPADGTPHMLPPMAHC